MLKVGAVLVRIDTAPLAGERPLNGQAAMPTLVGYGADAGIDTSRRRSRPLAAPPVRKLAKELLGRPRLDAARAGEVITRADVLVGRRRGPEPDSDVRPVHGVQARMAEKMTLSHNEIPDATVSVGSIAPNCCGCATGSVRHSRRSRRSC